MSEQIDERAAIVALQARPPVCSDLDEDCDSIADKVHCWLYDPAKGRCPYLSATNIERKTNEQ